MRRRGLALLVVVGILGVLMLLAVAFVAMARLERKASQGRTNATRALFLARSGIEDALARIHAGQDPSLLASRYGGEDADLSGGALDADERAQETFRIGVADGDLCPVRGALRPSFFVADRATGRPGRVAVGGRMKGYSGCLSGDHAPLGNVYALKVVDESGKINVNGGFLDGLNRDNDGSLDYRDTCVRAHPVPGANDPTDTGRGWNAQLARVLNNLGDLPELSISALGDKVLQNRPLGGYTSIAQLQTRLGLKTPLLFL